MKKSKRIYCLSVDFQGGDGADLFKIGGKWGLHGQENNFLEMLQLTTPPPEVKVVGFTKKQWIKIKKRKRD